MKLTKITFLVVAIVLASCTPATKTITITNNLAIDRDFETVEISKSDLKLEETDSLENYGLLDNKDIPQIIQYIDNNNDGKADILLFQPRVNPNTFATFTIVKTPLKSPQGDNSKEICYSRFVPERIDDYTWENDKVAFRVFGPVAQKMFEDGVEGGTISSGVDCWLKRVEYPIINKWYKKNTEGTGSYHEDTGEGLDNFHVGTSRGCGGIAVRIDTSYYISKNFISYKTLTTGSIRTSFYIEYADWDAGGNVIKESRIVSLDRGQNLSKFEITLIGSTHFSVGLTLHDKKGETTDNKEKGWISYWEAHDGSELGTAIVTQPEVIIATEKYETEQKDLSNSFMQLKLENNKAIYYTGFGWKKSKQFDSKEDWHNYLNEFSEKLKSPLEVSIN